MLTPAFAMNPSLMFRRRSFLRGLAVAVSGGLFLAATGAFGSGDAPMAQRVPYWAGVMVLGGLWGRVCIWALGRRIDVDDRPWAAIVLLTVTITGPLSVAVWALTGVVFEGGPPALQTLPVFLGPVSLVTATALALTVFLGRETPIQTQGATTPSPKHPAIHARLSGKLRGAVIYAVQAEDHYLRLHTEQGSDLILMRFSQALKELDGLEGAQTHRSWWVSRQAVRSVERGNGRASLTLVNGLKAPVSRRYARALRGDWW